MVLSGIVALAVLFAVGAWVSLPRVERVLASAIEQRLAEENIDVEVRMSGQDATLVCPVPIPALNAAVRYAANVEGVRSVGLDPSCTSGGIPVLEPASSTTIVVDGTIPATSTTSTTVAPAEPLTRVVLADGQIALEGSVASDAQRSLLVEAGAAAVGDDRLDDRVVVDVALALSDSDLEGIATIGQAYDLVVSKVK